MKLEESKRKIFAQNTGVKFAQVCASVCVISAEIIDKMAVWLDYAYTDTRIYM